jgi:hypothetical protein
MTDKARKLSVLLQTLSRIPGLGFLAQTEQDLREAADQVDEVGDRYEEGKRHMGDVRKASRDMVSSDEEEE